MTVDQEPNFPDDQVSGWRTGERGYPDPQWRGAEDRYPGDGYPAPDQRGGPAPDQRGGPAFDQRGGPEFDQRGGPAFDQRGGPAPDQRGGPPGDGRYGPPNDSGPGRYGEPARHGEPVRHGQPERPADSDRFGEADRFGDPDRFGDSGLGGAPDRLAGVPDRLAGSQDRLAGGPDRLTGAPDWSAGGLDSRGDDRLRGEGYGDPSVRRPEPAGPSLEVPLPGFAPGPYGPGSFNPGTAVTEASLTPVDAAHGRTDRGRGTNHIAGGTPTAYPIVEPGRGADPAGPLQQPTGPMPAVGPRTGPGGMSPAVTPSGGGQPGVGMPGVGMPGVGLPETESLRPHDGFHTEAIDREALRRPSGPHVPIMTEISAGPTLSAAPAGDGVYRTRRPAVAVLFAVLTLILEVPAVRVLLDGAVGGPVSPTGVLAGTFLVLGLPTFAAGLYGLATGAAGLVEPARGWLRPPVGYLTVGLVLFVAAALATT